jgi:hypothetical protein
MRCHTDISSEKKLKECESAIKLNRMLHQDIRSYFADHGIGFTARIKPLGMTNPTSAVWGLK